ncbi:MAG: hypothetical protein KDA87_23960 [Planctomycetales bacterium]|nr:hypothetical protein [Planctomycetales bacterium]
MNCLVRSSLLLLILVVGSSVAAQEPPRFLVNYTSSPPVIDGMVSSSSEWANASEFADTWSVLGSSDELDDSNSRFTALWSDDGLYFLYQTNYGGWLDQGRDQFVSSYESLNLYLDPNTDHESNFGSEPNDTGVDGYRLSLNMPEGSSVISLQARTMAVATDAHVNALFGNQGGPWSDFANMEAAQTNLVDDSEGLIELFLPWDNFDATSPDFFIPAIDDTGLYHPDAPGVGDEWFFNVARIQAGTSVTAWAPNPSSTFAAARPHGILEFVDGLSPVLDCDVNRDSICNASDIDLLSAAVRNENPSPEFDLNSDGLVNDDDRIYWIQDLMNTWVGDANLDGEFSSSDLVEVFVAGQYEDGVGENSGWAQGDWSGDAEFDTNDFVVAFQDGGFELGPRAVAAHTVPEPRLSFFLWTTLMLRAGWRRPPRR